MHIMLYIYIYRERERENIHTPRGSEGGGADFQLPRPERLQRVHGAPGRRATRGEGKLLLNHIITYCGMLYIYIYIYVYIYILYIYII